MDYWPSVTTQLPMLNPSPSLHESAATAWGVWRRIKPLTAAADTALGNQPTQTHTSMPDAPGIHRYPIKPTRVGSLNLPGVQLREWLRQSCCLDAQQCDLGMCVWQVLQECVTSANVYVETHRRVHMQHPQCLAPPANSAKSTIWCVPGMHTVQQHYSINAVPGAPIPAGQHASNKAKG